MRKILHRGKWLSYGEIQWTDAHGDQRSWEFTTREGTEGAVCVIAIKRGQPDQLILVKQYRPPVDGLVIELPAGLIDPGHSVEETALKELQEETGYQGKILRVGPPIYNTPGMTDEHVTPVVVEVAGQGAQNLQGEEEIEVIELPLISLREALQSLYEQGLLIDAKLWSIAEGLALGSMC